MPLPTAPAAQSPAPPTTTQSVDRPSDLAAVARQPAGDFFRLVACGQQADVELQFFQQLCRPAAVHNVEQQHAAGVADLGGEFAGEPAANFVLRQQHLDGFGEILRLADFAARGFSAR